MKACRFIMNTDYAMSQNDTEFDLSINIPSSWTQPHGTAAVVEFKAEKTIEGSSSRDFRCYLTSTAFNFAIVNAQEAYLQFGNDLITIQIARSKNKYTLKAFGGKDPYYDKTYSGTGQTITAHIQTFKDPFSEK